MGLKKFPKILVLNTIKFVDKKSLDPRIKEMGKRMEEKTPDTNLIGPTERKTANLV